MFDSWTMDCKGLQAGTVFRIKHGSQIAGNQDNTLKSSYFSCTLHFITSWSDNAAFFLAICSQGKLEIFSSTLSFKYKQAQNEWISYLFPPPTLKIESLLDWRPFPKYFQPRFQRAGRQRKGKIHLNCRWFVRLGRILKASKSLLFINTTHLFLALLCKHPWCVYAFVMCICVRESCCWKNKTKTRWQSQLHDQNPILLSMHKCPKLCTLFECFKGA